MYSGKTISNGKYFEDVRKSKIYKTGSNRQLSIIFSSFIIYYWFGQVAFIFNLNNETGVKQDQHQ